MWDVFKRIMQKVKSLKKKKKDAMPQYAQCLHAKQKHKYLITAQGKLNFSRWQIT